MSRHLKALGLALCAMFAFGVIAASAASATEFQLTTEADSTTLSLSGKITLIRPGETLYCELTAEGIADTAEAEFTVIGLSLTSCTLLIGGGEKMSLDAETNGCSILFTIAEETEAGKYSGSTHIKCPAGKQIELKQTVVGLKINCLKFHEQTPTAPTVDFTNEGEDGAMGVKIRSTMDGFTTERFSTCGSTESNDGTLISEMTLGGSSGITVS